MISPFRSRIPMASDGSLPTFTLDGKKCAGKDFLDFAGTVARQAYYLPLSSKERAVRENLDTAPVFESLDSRMKAADTDECWQIRAQINITKCKQGAFQPPPLVVHSALRSVHLRKGGGNVYLAMCDDNREELDTVLSLLDAQQAERGAALLRRAFQSAVELVETARQEKFTLYLLDVMMPGMDGLDAAREIRRFDDVADIVFLSTSPGFAYESYGVRALNYLLKPVEGDKLFALLDQLSLREQKPLEALTLKTATTIIRVPYAHISYVEVMGKHVYFHLVDRDVREVVGSLRDFEAALLPRPEFMRVHRSYIVNMLQVEELSSNQLRTLQGETLPVSRLTYPQLQKDYMALLFEQRGAGT